jgi:hypothetical protein
VDWQDVLKTLAEAGQKNRWQIPRRINGGQTGGEPFGGNCGGRLRKERLNASSRPASHPAALSIPLRPVLKTYS